jgi:hypothetical protein
VASSFSAGTNVTGGANSGAKLAELAETRARMSMSEDDSVTFGVTRAGACLASVASEKSTLLSLRSPV